MSRGWDLIAEDSVFVLPGDGAEIRGVPAFIHLLDDALRFFPNMSRASRIITRRSGATKHEIDIRTTFNRPMQVSATLSGLMFLEAKRAVGLPVMRKLTSAQSAKRLARSQPFGPSYARWPDALAHMAALPAFTLTLNDDVWQGVDLINHYRLEDE